MKKFAMIALAALTIVSAAAAGSFAINSGSQKNNSSTNSARRVNAADVQGEDMTSLITNPSFSGNNSNGWSGSTPQFQSYGNAEFYNTSFNFYQKLSGLKNGVYRVNVKGFYRAGDRWDAAYYYHEEGATTNLNAYVYAQDSKVRRQTPIQSICTGETEASLGNGTEYNDYGYVPNTMESANTYCNAGYYNENIVYFQVTDGTMTIGIYKNNTLDYDWTLFDDWSLYYLGEDLELPEGEEEEIPQLDSIVSSGDIPVTVTNDPNNPWGLEGATAIIRGKNQSNYYTASWLTMSYSSEKRTEFSFEWAIYDYSYHEALQVYIDGVYKGNTTNSSYTTQRFYLDAGEHVIAFRDSVSYRNYTNNWSGIRNIKVKEILPLETAVLTDNSLPLTFTNDETWPWTIEDGYIQNGNYGHNNTTSKISTTFSIDKTSRFSLLYRCMRANGNSGNGDYHQFKVRINGIQYDYAYSRTEFNNPVIYALEPGTYTVEFVDSVYNTSTAYVTQIKDVELSENWITCELASAGTLGVEALYQVNVLNDVEMLKVVGPMNSADWKDIKNMTNLRALDLSEAVLTEIPNNAFKDKGWLNSVILPEGITRIGEYAFQGTNIRRIIIPSTVTTIAQYAFKGTPIQSVTFADNSQIKTIANHAFYQCNILKGFNMPNSVISIGERCFYECTNLKELWLSDALISLPNYLAYKADIRQLHLPANLQTIGYNTFDLNQHLQKVDLPSTLTSIGEYAFSGCYALDSIILPIHLNSLGYRAFYVNTALKYVELPSYITYDRQFEGCTGLNTVVCRSATPPSISSDPFQDARVKSAITLKVPSFAVVNYKLDSYWYQFGSIVEGDDIDYWKITSPLSLTNNRRMQGKPDIDLYYGGQFTVGGNAPMEIGQFNYYVSESNPGRLLNTCEAMTADGINSYFSVDSEKWYFITPVHDVDLTKVTVSNDASYVFRYYDGDSRATNGTGNSWRNVDNGKLTAGQGYIFRCNTNAVVTFPAEAGVHAQVFNTADVTKQLAAYEAAASANKSWNFVGNPYPCYYDIYYMDFTAPITVWTGSTYKAYSIVDDSYALRPMQAFFVQKPDAVDNIIFHKEGRQLTSDINHAAAARPFHAPANGKRSFFEIQMIGDEMTDETRVVINENASLSYEIECDASKFMSFEPTVPQIFTLDSDANGYAINERPLADGHVKLAYYAGQSGFYTISAKRADGDIYLYDAQLNKTVNLMEQDYTFYSDATEGSNTTRFMLSLIVISDVTTSVEAIENSELKKEDSFYDLQGRKTSATKKGLYIKDGQKIVRQ